MSAPICGDAATAVQRRPADGSEPVVVGLLAAPGPAQDVADELARELPTPLHERLPGVAWLFVVRTDVRAGPAGIDVDLVRVVRERMLAEGWDLAICLTELPLRVGRRPVRAYASVALSVGLVSVQALGALEVEDRVRDSLVRLLDGTVRGKLRVLVGMIRANRPWGLITRLSRALAAALGTAAFSLVSPGVWKVAAGAGAPRMLLLALGSILVTCASLIVPHRLWERSPGPEARDRSVVLNVAIVLTTILGVLTLYLALLVINAACVGLLIPSGVLAEELGDHVGVADYLQIAWLVSSLGTIGGALGVVVESDQDVREAVYGYRADQ